MMASERQSRPRPFLPMEAWPPDDTEESVLGTDLHQTTITNLRWGINEVASLHRAPDLVVPWKALSQIALLGCVHRDGSAYRTYPDVFVYLRAIERNRGSVTLEVDGPPALIIEVLSESTYEADLDLVRGKSYSYERAGVQECLTIDPTGEFLAQGIRAWHLVQGRYLPWEPDANGRWQSDQIPIAIGLEGSLATVYTRDGRRMLREGEIERERAREREERDRLREELERLRRLLHERGEQ